jgi:hypothetical protein
VREWPLAFVLLGGCDLLFKVRDLPDAAVLPPDADCMVMIGRDESLTQGVSFTADRSEQRAVKQMGDVLFETVGDVDTNESAAFHVMFTPPENLAFATPQLASGAAELVVRIDNTMLNTSTLGVSRRSGDTWSMPLPIGIFDETGTNPLAVDRITLPSPPTTTNPRKMLVTSSRGLEEFAESVQDRWIRRGVFVLSNLEVQSVDFGMLTPDATHVIYSGIQGGQPEIRRADRNGPDGGILGTKILHNGFGAVPFFTADCQDHLYYSATDGTIHHVIVE